MARGRKSKDPFDALDNGVKDALTSMSIEEVKKRVAEIALDLDRLMEAKKADQDLAEKTEAAKFAGEVYREGSKDARLRIRYANVVLTARGAAPVPTKV